MPVGIIINVSAVIIGGLIGTFAGKALNQQLKDTLNLIFGLCAMLLGITSVVLVKNLPAVILSVIIGTALGVMIKLGDKINKAAVGMQHFMSRFVKPPKSGLTEDEFTAMLVTILVLFCSSGSGIYGSIVSGMNGDNTILISKSILDFFSAMICACSLGLRVSVVAVPQAVIFLTLFFLAKIIFPLTNETMINDFKAVGGMILIATSFRMIKVKEFPVADMIPSMIIAMPLSWLYATYILPLLG